MRMYWSDRSGVLLEGARRVGESCSGGEFWVYRTEGRALWDSRLQPPVLEDGLHPICSLLSAV